MSKDPNVTAPSVNEHLSSAGPEAQTVAGANFERFMNELRQEGREEGRQEWLRREEELRIGLAETLVSMMSERFGAVASDHEARIQSADLEQLQKWLRKLGTSSSLGELLEPQA